MYYVCVLQCRKIVASVAYREEQKEQKKKKKKTGMKDGEEGAG